MFFKKPGIPTEGELVICTVNKILYHSVFVSIDEYRSLEGMVHISEIAPGRIRNLRDYVREGKQIVCKVLKVDEIKGHIDLSLRRVNPAARANKLNELKQEERSEKILEVAAKKLNIDLAKIYAEAGSKIIASYGMLTPCFYDIVANGESVLKKVGISDDYVMAIAEAVKGKISLPEVSISGTLKLQNFASNGIVLIKNVLAKAFELAKSKSIDMDILYLGAPSYKLDVRSTDYKSAEDKRQLIVDLVVKEMKASGGIAEFLAK